MNGELIMAVHAAVYLYHRGGRRTSAEIAENVCTNPVCVRRVLSKLVKAGIIDKKEGAGSGGYCGESCGGVTLGAVADALNAEIVSAKYHSGEEDKECMIASGMSVYIDSLCAEMDATCRRFLDTISISDVETALAAAKERRAP